MKHAIHGNQPTNHIRFTPEVTLPDPVTQNDDVVVAFGILLFDEQASLKRLYTEHLQQARGASRAANPDWLPVSSKIEPAYAERSDLQKGTALFPHVEVIWAGEWLVRENLALCLPHRDEALRLRVRKIAQHDTFEDRKDRSAATDPYGQRQCDKSRESGPARNLSQRESDILASRIDELLEFRREVRDRHVLPPFSKRISTSAVTPSPSNEMHA